jgi:hypothetical protein
VLLNRSVRGNRIQKSIANDGLGAQEVSALFRDALK